MTYRQTDRQTEHGVSIWRVSISVLTRDKNCPPLGSVRVRIPLRRSDRVKSAH